MPEAAQPRKPRRPPLEKTATAARDMHRADCREQGVQGFERQVYACLLTVERHTSMNALARAIGAPFLGALLLYCGAAQADITLTANLTNDQETAPVVPTTSTGAPRPESFGTAVFVIDDAMTSMSWTATIFNIDVTGAQSADVNDNLTLAHIHGPAAPGFNAPAIWGFFGTPFNETSPNDFALTPFASGVGGTFSGKWDLPEGNNTTFAAQVGNILAGLTYMNFHTVQFGAGEIRGQIQVVPEPETYLLMLAGLAGIGAMARRRRNASPAGV